MAKIAWAADLLAFRPVLTVAEQVKMTQVKGGNAPRKGPIVGRREPAQLPAAVKLPLPAPGEAAEPEPVVSEPAPVTAAGVEPVPDVPARKRMIRPPRPEDLARRPAPEPEPAKAEKADEKKE